MAHIYNSQLDAFELYHHVHNTQGAGSSNLLSPSGSALPALGHAIAGSVGAAISNLCTYPLDLVTTRLQIQRQLGTDSKGTAAAGHGEDGHRSVQDVAWRIYEAEGGLSAFYAGFLPDTGKTIADSFLFFLVYNFLRRRRNVARGGEAASAAFMLPVLDELAIGFVAGSFTKLFTTPIGNIVTRKQTSAMASSGAVRTSADSPTTHPESSSKPPSTAQIARKILQQKGMSGFWSGYPAALVLTLNPSLTFFLFESLKRIFLPRSKRANPPPSATFILAALSKACASSVTYPFSVAKVRAQAGSSASKSTADLATESKIQDAPPPPPLPPSSPSPSPSAIENFIPALFSTLVSTIRTEGLASLYSGLSLEVIKSFVSHGTTMLVKQYVHRLIIQAYYMLSLVSARLRSRGLSTIEAGNLLERARGQRHEYYDLARRRAGERASQVKAIGGDLAQGFNDKAADLVADYVEEGMEERAADSGKGLSGMTGLARWFEER